MERGCMSAGRTCGDLVFPIPYCPELHFSEFHSVVADMKNSVKVRPHPLVLTINYNETDYAFVYNNSRDILLVQCFIYHM